MTLSSRERYNELVAMKRSMEERIFQVEKLLDDLGVGRHGSLVDDEGFPLKEVDHYLVRTKRNEINCITS